MGNTNKLMKGLGSGDLSWQDDFVLTDDDQRTPLFKVELDNGNVTMAGTLTVAGVPVAGSSSVLYLNVVTVANATATPGEVLMTYSMPAGTLAAGHGVRATTWGTAVGITTTSSLYFGATSVANRSESSLTEEYRLISEIFYIGASSQAVSSVGFVDASVGTGHFVTSETASGIIVIKSVCTAPSANKVQCYGLLVERI